MDFGFKNVNLGNVYPIPSKATVKFLPEADVDFLCKYANESLTLIVALHELLGHGTGKLYMLDSEGKPSNFSAETLNPFTKEPINIKNCYTDGETWGQKFGKLHSGYEECRADSVALHLIHL
jgi:dipeptidyl-peptidase III